MKESMWGYYLILLGIFVSTFMIMVTNMTTTNQQDYYLLKEVTNAAMIDAIDYGYYRTYGEMKINTEKFVENFIRRFTEGISKTNSYKIDFYSIYENPPSVSIKVTSNTGDYHIFGDSTNIDVVNSIDAILEANNTMVYSQTFYSVPYAHCNEENQKANGYCQLTNRVLLKLESPTGQDSLIYEEIKKKKNLSVLDSSKVKILNVEYISPMIDSDDLNMYEDLYEKVYLRNRTTADVPASISTNSNYLAKNIKNVTITMKHVDNKYYLAYGLDFNCNGAWRFGNTETGDPGVIKRFRKIPDENMPISEYNTNYSTGSVYSDTEQAGYGYTPYYDNCLVGIKYKVNFYYDENAK